MLNEMFANSPIPVLEQLVNFSQSRHKVLASNIANIDTPGYRTRDLSVEKFQDKLKGAIDVRDNDATSTSLGNTIHVDPFDKVREGMNNILYHDDSNVGI